MSQAIWMRILRRTLRRLDQVLGANRVRVLPGMCMIVGVGEHGLTLKKGGVAQGRCLNGGGEKEGESGKFESELHDLVSIRSGIGEKRMWGV